MLFYFKVSEFSRKTAFAKNNFPLSQKDLNKGLSTIYTKLPRPFLSEPNNKDSGIFLTALLPA